jgi:hypothetical protein
MLKVSSIDCIKLKTLSGFEVKVDELEHSDDNKEKKKESMSRTYKASETLLKD